MFFINSFIFLAGITKLTFSSVNELNLTYFLASLYESVATHSKLFPIIFKFIPVNKGLLSCWEVANTVWLTISLKLPAVNLIGSLPIYILVLGNSL